MEKPRIVFFGTPDFAVPTLQKLIERDEKILAVVTQPDRPVGRGQKLKTSPVKELALQHSLPVLQPEKVKKPECIDSFKALNPDLAVVVAFGQIFPKTLLDIPRHGFINVHSSLLPAYRGAAPINHAVIDGCAESGVTIMQLDEGMDSGAILLQATTPIDVEDTAATLHDRLSDLGAELLGEALDQLAAGGWKPVPQDHSLATYAPMLKKSDGLIDWTKEAASIANQVRGMTPWPGCFTYLDGKMLKVHTATVVDTEASTAPGEIVSSTGRGIEVATGGGMLVLQHVQLEGKKRMPAADFLKGHQVKPGTVLTNTP